MDICTIVNDTYRMLLAHASSIGESAAHVFQSVLPMLPTNSLLSQSYTNTNPLDCHAICIKGLESNWSSCLMTLREHSGTVTTVVSSPDGGLLASASIDNTIKLWDLHTGEHLRTLGGHSFHVNSVAFSPDGGLLASASRDKTMKLWDPHTGEHLRTLEGHSSDVTSVAFSPDGGLLASASWDNTMKLWDPHTGEHLRTLEGHSSEVTSLAFSSYGGPLTSVSGDNTLTPRDFHTTECPPESLSPMGSPLHVHSTSQMGNSLVHDVHSGKLVHSGDESSFPQINGGQDLILMNNHWVCAGPAYIFYLPPAFHMSTWKHKGPFVCFGSGSGEVLILDISPATSTLCRM